MKKVYVNGKLIDRDKAHTRFSFSGPRPMWAKRISQIWTTIAGITAIVLANFANYIDPKILDIIKNVLITVTPALVILCESLGMKQKNG